VDGFPLAVGFCGHGFQHSPMTGRMVAEWIVDGKPSMDLSLFQSMRLMGDKVGTHRDSEEGQTKHPKPGLVTHAPSGGMLNCLQEEVNHVSRHRSFIPPSMN
jgi:hypothetical protein